jgi:superfamily II DNA/RNA helicase
LKTLKSFQFRWLRKPHQELSPRPCSLLACIARETSFNSHIDLAADSTLVTITMGKRGKRNRSKRKEVGAEAGADGADSNSAQTTEQPSPKELLTVTVEGDDSFRVPPPMSASALDHEENLAPFRKAWTVLENRTKSATNSWTPTPIQLQAWPVLLKSKIDLIGIAPTGSGKTYAYGLPLLSQIDRKKDLGIQGMVLLPTRELALQVKKDLKRAKMKPIKMVAVYGGVDRESQLEDLLVDDVPIIVAATPGRLGDLLNDERLKDKLSGLKWIVMDEADRLAIQIDMSKQVDDILEILGKDPDRRMCMFSATHPQSAASKWASWIRKQHVIIKVNTVTVGGQLKAVEDQQYEDMMPNSDAEAIPNKENDGDGEQGEDEEIPSTRKAPGPMDLARIPANVTQTLHVCSAHKKPKKLMTTLQKVRPAKGSRVQSLCLVFFARIKTLQYVSKLLRAEGVECSELHSHLSQRDREQVLHHFQCGKIQTLLATDVAARGIHVPNIETVINYDFPISLEQYVHRCGRAGRSSEKPATVYSFFTRELQPMAADVLSLLKETDAWIDPNLVELAGEKPAGKRAARKRKRLEESKTAPKPQEGEATAAPGVDGDEADMDDGEDIIEDDYDDEINNRQFSFLNPKRIVLQRASHVSDASSDSGGEVE